MSATVGKLEVARLKRVRQEPYAAFFAQHVSLLDDTHHFTKMEWRLLAFAFGHLQYGQRFWDSSLTELSETLQVSRQAVYRAVKRLLSLRVFYRQHHGGYYPELYLSSHIAYRGKMRVLPRFRQLEAHVQDGLALSLEGAVVDLEYTHAWLGGVPDISWPEWLIDHCKAPSEDDYARAGEVD